jgi:hypothetical protein
MLKRQFNKKADRSNQMAAVLGACQAIQKFATRIKARG